MTADFTSETIKPVEKNEQTNIQYQMKLTYINEGKIKAFPDRQKLREFVTICPALQTLLKDVLHSERKKNIQHHEIL